MIEVLQLLHNLESKETTRYSTSYYVRHLESYEPVPQDSGYPENPKMQKDWIWVAFSTIDHKPLGTLIAAPCQGVALLLRLHASSGKVLVGLLRKALEDMNSRGYPKYMVALSGSREEEIKLFRIIKKAGGDKVSDCVILTGPTDIGGL